MAVICSIPVAAGNGAQRSGLSPRITEYAYLAQPNQREFRPRWFSVNRCLLPDPGAIQRRQIIVTGHGRVFSRGTSAWDRDATFAASLAKSCRWHLLRNTGMRPSSNDHQKRWEDGQTETCCEHSAVSCPACSTMSSKMRLTGFTSRMRPAAWPVNTPVFSASPALKAFQ